MSRTRQLGPSGAWRERNSCAVPKVSERRPTDFSRPAIAAQTSTSSSMTNTVGDRTFDGAIPPHTAFESEAPRLSQRRAPAARRCAPADAAVRPPTRVPLRDANTGDTMRRSCACKLFALDGLARQTSSTARNWNETCSPPDAAEDAMMSAVATNPSVRTAAQDYAGPMSLQSIAATRRAHGSDISAELLRAIANVVDIRRVFPRVSEVVNHVLPHDVLALAYIDRSGSATLEAASTEEFPGREWCASTNDEAVSVVSDLCSVHSGVATARHGHGRASRPRDSAPSSASGARRAVQVLRLGFFSKKADTYSLKDAAAAQTIADCVGMAVAHQQLAVALRDAADAPGRSDRLDLRVRDLADKGHLLPAYGRMFGASARWRRVLADALRVAPTDATVFLRGESGTGKELVARFIHQASPRSSGPFIAINCAALPEQLLEAELFGYERGAFTGANQSKPGQVELAAKGVLFLDEVSEMSRAAQAKMLRFLQEREFQRLGGTRMQKAQVRVIAASNRDLRQAVQQGDFREDLFYRLQVFDIELPPLRERIGDIALLADRFVEELAGALGRARPRLTRGRARCAAGARLAGQRA